jgi:hypothetical protein
VNFRVLPSQLHPTAEEVVRFFTDDRGISKFKVEEPVSNDLDYRPTLQATAPEYYDFWIEVSETPYLISLDGVVLYCVTNCLPVKLYVAFPAGTSSTEYKKCADEARTKGVGLLEVSPGRCVVIHEALLLSLSGARSEDRSQFPARYRSVLSTAEATFRNGDPAKGCSLVYDEIEALSRRLARKIQKNNWWTHLSSGTPAFNADKDAWASVMDILINRTNFNALPPAAKKSLLMRVAALTDVRNDTGHKPKNRAARIKRDRELRTRFESAIDVLRDFVNALRPLRL